MTNSIEDMPELNGVLSGAAGDQAHLKRINDACRKFEETFQRWENFFVAERPLRVKD